MSIIVACNCGKKYRLKDELAGKKFKCKFQFRTFDRSSCERCEVSEEVEIIFALCRVERHCR